MEMSQDKLHQRAADRILTPSEYEKVVPTLIEHVYSQAGVAFFSSIFCAAIIFLGMLYPVGNYVYLWLWVVLFLGVTFLRVGLYFFYKRYYQASKAKFWGGLYTVGCLLGGVTWGLGSILLMPYANPAQQMLMVLMLAGVTAGSVPLSAALPLAGIGFLVTALFPYVVGMLFLENETFYLFDAALALYFIYTIVLTLKIYRLIKKSIVLKYENDALLINLRKSNKLLEQSSTHDPLTNVSNRRLFLSTLNEAIIYSNIHHTALGLFYIDLDLFKQANDAYGHAAGDLILKVIANKLNAFFRKEDILARLGGDEFAVIIEEIKNIEHIESIAKKICQLVGEPIHMDDITLHVTASIGVSVFPKDGKTVDELIVCADQRMFRAKRSGGDQYCIAT